VPCYQRTAPSCSASQALRPADAAWNITSYPIRYPPVR